jgi:hypothetical protein
LQKTQLGPIQEPGVGLRIRSNAAQGLVVPNFLLASSDLAREIAQPSSLNETRERVRSHQVEQCRWKVMTTIGCEMVSVRRPRPGLAALDGENIRRLRWLSQVWRMTRFSAPLRMVTASPDGAVLATASAAGRSCPQHLTASPQDFRREWRYIACRCLNEEVAYESDDRTFGARSELLDG